MQQTTTSGFRNKTSRHPLVSVIIPVFNREDFIVNTLDSLKYQDYRPIEIIVVDDGSTDNTSHVVDNWRLLNTKPGFHMTIINQQNQGAPMARNHGVDEAKGIYVQFLDSDDTLEPIKIAKQVEILEKTNGDFAVCDFRYVDEKGNCNKICLNNGNLLFRVIQGWSIYTSSPLIRSTLFKGKINWNPKLTANQDIDFFFKIFTLTANYIYTPGVWCNYVQHSFPRISNTRNRGNFIARIASLVSFLKSLPWNTSPTEKIIITSGIIWLMVKFFYANARKLFVRVFRNFQ